MSNLSCIQNVNLSEGLSEIKGFLIMSGEWEKNLMMVMMGRQRDK